MAVFPTLATDKKVTCGIPLPASLSIASVRREVSSQDTAKYPCEEGHTVTGLVGTVL